MGTFRRGATRRGANLGSGAPRPARLWITCGQRVDCLWIAVHRNKLIFLTRSCGEKAYYCISVQANGPKKKAIWELTYYDREAGWGGAKWD